MAARRKQGPHKPPSDPAELQNLRTLGVSLVKAGANRKWIALEKAEEMKGQLLAVFKQLVEKGELPDEAKIVAACTTAGLDEKETEAIKAIMRIRAAFPSPDKLDAAMKAALVVPGTEEPKEEPPAMPVADAPAAKEPATEVEEEPTEETTNPAEEAEDEEEEDMADTKDVKKGEAPVSKADENAKQIDELKALMKAQQDELAIAKGEAKKNADALRAEQDKRRESEWLAKAEQLKGVPGKTPVELAKALMEMEDKVSPEFAAQHFEMLKAASVTIQKSALFQETPRGSAGQGGSAWAKVEALADERIEKSLDADDEDGAFSHMTPSLRAEIVKAKAITKALLQNKGLYNEHLQEQKGSR